MVDFFGYNEAIVPFSWLRPVLRIEGALRVLESLPPKVQPLGWPLLEPQLWLARQRVVLP